MDYYETKFREDLRRYCEKRLDSYLFGRDFRDDVLEFADADRHIRFGCAGWEPENQLGFYFSLYFTVLTDTALYSHFPAQHVIFDQIAQYPKLFGLGVYNRLLPISVLSALSFKEHDQQFIEELWRSYCNYFINDWQVSLPKICGVSGNDFLKALLKDEDLQYSVSRCDKQREYEQSPDCLEALLVDLIRKEVNQS